MNLIKYRKNRERISLIIKSLIVLFAGFVLFHCADRNKSNIFDPDSGIDSLDIGLNVISADTCISIRWSAPTKVQFEGYNLFRIFSFFLYD